MNHLRLKLVAILALVALLPALPAALAVKELLDRVWEPLRNPVLLEGAEAGLAATRDRLDVERAAFEERVANDEAQLIDAPGLEAYSTREQTSLLDLPITSESRPERVTLAGEDRLVVRTGERAWLTAPLPPALVAQARDLTESVTFLQSLRRGETDIVRSFVLAFLAVYGVTLALVLAGGLFLASRLTRPLGALGDGIDAVASGNLDTEVKPTGAPEIRRLLEEFNAMTATLRAEREQRGRLEKIEAWRQMARRLAHEIKNPLTPIQLAAQQMRDTYPGEDATYKELLVEASDIIEEEVSGLRDLVTEFSHFARLPKPSLAKMRVSDIVGDLSALYRDHQLDVRIANGSGDREIWGDRQQVHRVFINLINNGLDAQRDANTTGAVELAVNGDATGGADRPIEVTVRDHGPGVPDDLADRIFEPDFTTKSDGMGLGLAIVQAIVQGHGGDIRVSNHPDGGAVFHTWWRERAEEAP